MARPEPTPYFQPRSFYESEPTGLNAHSMICPSATTAALSAIFAEMFHSSVNHPLPYSTYQLSLPLPSISSILPSFLPEFKSTHQKLVALETYLNQAAAIQPASPFVCVGIKEGNWGESSANMARSSLPSSICSPFAACACFASLGKIKKIRR